MLKIFLDVKYDKYSAKNSNVMSIALMSYSYESKDILYLENMDYVLVADPTIVETQRYRNLLLRTNPATEFEPFVHASKIALTSFSDTISTWLSKFHDVEIVISDPLQWLLFVDIFGSKDNLPVNVEREPLYMETLYASKGFSGNYNDLIKDQFFPLTESSLFDVIKLQQVYKKLNGGS